MPLWTISGQGLSEDSQTRNASNYEDVVYRLTCRYVYLRDNATYPGFHVSGIMAGRIVATSIESVAADLLVFYNMTISVVCRNGVWKCILSSNMFDESITFYSDAQHIREDIQRCSLQLIRDWPVTLYQK